MITSLPCRAQWKTVGDPTDYQALAFGIHDSNLFVSYPDADPFHERAVIYRFVPPNGWVHADGGIDRTQGNITSFASLGPYVFCGQGAIYRSINNGLTWTINDSIGSPIGTNGRELFALDAKGISRSTDSGSTWISTGNNLIPNNFAAIGPCVLATISSGLYRSTNNGETWAPESTPISNIQSFAVVGTSIYAANTQVMKSSDSGATWSIVSTPSLTIQSLATDGKRLFAGGPQGVYLLDTGGATWTSESDSLKGHAVLSLCVFDTVLFADFTFGGSIPYELYSRSIPEIISQKSAVQAISKPGDTVAIYPNPANGLVTIFAGGTAIERVSVLNVLGVDVLDVPQPRESEISLDLSLLPSGTYFVRIETAAGSVLRKVIRE